MKARALLQLALLLAQDQLADFDFKEHEYEDKQGSKSGHKNVPPNKWSSCADWRNNPAPSFNACAQTIGNLQLLHNKTLTHY